MPRDRLPPETFDLPVEKIRSGYYSDAYFNFAREALLADGRRPRVLMQVFQKNDAILGGMDEAIAVLKLCSHDWDALDVRALHDGDAIEPWETVLTIEGDYTLFAHLETVYLGVLARRTLVSTNVRRVVEAAAPKPILFFPARHDHWLVQTGDGYAAHVAGAIGVSTDAQSSWWGGRGIGTVPHALIACYGGDTVEAARHFAAWAPEDMNVVVLVDFENDSVRTALEVARALGPKLWGVRLDTSERLVDRSLWDELGDFDPRGVNARLVQQGSCRARRRGLRRRAGSSSRAASPSTRSARSSRRACRWTSTASARRSCAGRTTSRPTSSASRDARCAKVGRVERPNPRLEPVQ